jgi:hypothetical protein
MVSVLHWRMRRMAEEQNDTSIEMLLSRQPADKLWIGGEPSKKRRKVCAD